MSERKPQDFDPLEPETFDSAHERVRRPAAALPGGARRCVGRVLGAIRYDDVRRAASDPRTFITSVQNVVPKVAFTGRRPPLHLDPPEHTPYRRALNPLLSDERVASSSP